MVHADVREPLPEALSGRAPGRVARRLFLATRPMFFTASMPSVVVGTVWGYRASGGIDVLAFVLALLATVLVHAGANVANDVYDDLGGSDRVNDDRIYPYTGGSRFIQNRVMDVRGLGLWSAGLLAAAVLVGAALAILAGPAVLLFGVAGVGLGLLYSAPPAQLSARGLGEPVVAVAFGVLPVTGAAWLQGGALSLDLFLASVLVAMWVGAILMVNEVPDIRADRSAGKRTLVVRLGPGGTGYLYAATHGAGFAAAAALVARNALPWGFLVGLVVLLLAAIGVARAISAAGADRARLKRAIQATLAIHAVGSLWLTGWILLAA